MFCFFIYTYIQVGYIRKSSQPAHIAHLQNPLFWVNITPSPFFSFGYIGTDCFSVPEALSDPSLIFQRKRPLPRDSSCPNFHLNKFGNKMWGKKTSLETRYGKQVEQVPWQKPAPFLFPIKLILLDWHPALAYRAHTPAWMCLNASFMLVTVPLNLHLVNACQL